MKDIFAKIGITIITKLTEKVLTPENIEKYSDKFLDAARNLIKKSENELDDALLPLLDVLDKCIGE